MVDRDSNGGGEDTIHIEWPISSGRIHG